MASCSDGQDSPSLAAVVCGDGESQRRPGWMHLNNGSCRTDSNQTMILPDFILPLLSGRSWTCPSQVILLSLKVRHSWRWAVCWDQRFFSVLRIAVLLAWPSLTCRLLFLCVMTPPCSNSWFLPPMTGWLGSLINEVTHICTPKCFLLGGDSSHYHK